MTKDSGRVVCITGASAGIGRATAEVFAQNGWSIALGARRKEFLDDLVLDLTHRGAPKVVTCSLDVRDPDSVDQFATLVLKNFKTIDVLVNNAGLAAGTDKLASVKTSDIEAMMETNVMGLLRVTQKFLPGMLAADHGHIVNLGSIAGHVVYEGGGIYCATKHAVQAISKTLRLEVNGTKIRISNIAPGMVETDFSRVRFQDDSKAKAVYKGMTPLNGHDIAECIYFAASRPAHVNIDEIIVMPVDQAAIHKVNRKSE